MLGYRCGKRESESSSVLMLEPWRGIIPNVTGLVSGKDSIFTKISIDSDCDRQTTLRQSSGWQIAVVEVNVCA